MNSRDKAFALGFIKRAVEKGLTKQQAWALLEKEAGLFGEMGAGLQRAATGVGNFVNKHMIDPVKNIGHHYRQFDEQGGELLRLRNEMAEQRGLARAGTQQKQFPAAGLSGVNRNNGAAMSFPPGAQATKLNPKYYKHMGLVNDLNAQQESLYPAFAEHRNNLLKGMGTIGAGVGGIGLAGYGGIKALQGDPQSQYKQGEDQDAYTSLGRESDKQYTKTASDERILKEAGKWYEFRKRGKKRNPNKPAFGGFAKDLSTPSGHYTPDGKPYNFSNDR